MDSQTHWCGRGTMVQTTGVIFPCWSAGGAPQVIPQFLFVFFLCVPRSSHGKPAFGPALAERGVVCVCSCVLWLPSSSVRSSLLY